MELEISLILSSSLYFLEVLFLVDVMTNSLISFPLVFYSYKELSLPKTAIKSL